ncbi:response regulator transcription factor [Paenibacillus rhizovicinus]|uniref:Response regulator transcription factor n=1 Tax=Paenibacillus rhizovicinus TaxID=2704463 RepID=A0A6C0PCM4_9BACL|nr:response regulator transcription factor [Paenibacillus rhizovicinus]QHW34862.1 response regulator transcription factor [Paenibacillus rhizovicinus]
MRMLVVEDDATLLRIIRDVFEGESFLTDGAETGDEGYFLAEQAIHDLIVLDVMLPGMSGLEIISKLRAKSIRVPIILLTARDAINDRVAGLDAGADDYLTKPFAVSELLARARAVLRRKGTIGLEGEMTCGVIRIVPSAREAFNGDTPLLLTATEYKLLEFFLGHKNQILTREQIFDRIWGFDSGSATTAVDVYVHLLRKKLSAVGAGNILQTVRGIGYLVKGDTDVQ